MVSIKHVDSMRKVYGIIVSYDSFDKIQHRCKNQDEKLLAVALLQRLQPALALAVATAISIRGISLIGFAVTVVFAVAITIVFAVSIAATFTIAE